MIVCFFKVPEGSSHPTWEKYLLVVADSLCLRPFQLSTISVVVCHGLSFKMKVRKGT